jgi:hypothetical protein
MGREIKRVALDFEWPMDKVWEGFLLPDSLHGRRCEHCNGSGQTHFGWWLQHFSYLMGMLAEDVRDQEHGEPMHPWLKEFPHPHGHFNDRQFVIDRPSRDALNFFAALLEVEPEKINGGIFGSERPHYIVMRKLLALAGTDVTCSVCNGEGSTEVYPGQRAEAETWEPVEPPAGPGWQMWETVSEGSPISPVFADAEGLVQWMMSPAVCWGATKTPYTRQQAESFVGIGWAPTGMSLPGNGFVDGITGVTTLSKES